MVRSRSSRSSKRTAAAAAVGAGSAVVKPEPVEEEPMMVIDDHINETNTSTSSAIDVDVDVDVEDDDGYDDDDDPIVREIEVFISPDLTGTATLVQYPLRPSSFVVGRSVGDDDSFTPLAARTKPRHSMLELDYALPSSAGYYNDSSNNVEELSDARTFASQSIPVSTHMALGRLDATGNRLDLVPLTSVLQMRPTFSHIDAADPHQQAAEAAAAEAAAAAAAQQQTRQGGSGPSKPLLFKRKESERAATARRQSFAHLKSEQDAEEWVDLHVASESDAEHKRTVSKVKCRNRSNALRLAKTAAGGSKGYVDSLNYLPATDLTDGGMATAGDVPLPDVTADAERFKTELTAKIATLLTSSGGIPVPYPVFRSRFVGQNIGSAAASKGGKGRKADPAAPTEEMLIECLSSAAALVRGNWVLKTTLCGLSDRVAESRDVCLLILNKHGYLRRQSLMSALTKPNDVDGMIDNDADAGLITEHLINQLLAPITIKGHNALVLRVEDDDTFPVRFPEQAKKHQLYWEKKEEALRRYVSAYEDLENLSK